MKTLIIAVTTTVSTLATIVFSTMPPQHGVCQVRSEEVTIAPPAMRPIDTSGINEIKERNEKALQALDESLQVAKKKSKEIEKESARTNRLAEHFANDAREAEITPIAPNGKVRGISRQTCPVIIHQTGNFDSLPKERRRNAWQRFKYLVFPKRN